MVTVAAVKSLPPAACAMGGVFASAGLVPARVLETGAGNLAEVDAHADDRDRPALSRSRRVPGYGLPKRAVA